MGIVCTTLGILGYLNLLEQTSGMHELLPFGAMGVGAFLICVAWERFLNVR